MMAARKLSSPATNPIFRGFCTGKQPEKDESTISRLLAVLGLVADRLSASGAKLGLAADRLSAGGAKLRSSVKLMYTSLRDRLINFNFTLHLRRRLAFSGVGGHHGSDLSHNSRFLTRSRIHVLERDSGMFYFVPMSGVPQQRIIFPKGPEDESFRQSYRQPTRGR
ncbi:hypothetical protein L1987_11714 [Smallanthus sonchifolius]|uniref:Uncharacterized protein n=1 Tax=Smallanthus sonchifolius TaxID=185202 RepID=A0ACB9JBT2_9ASTR|nr:hypothetical protein L1987_11714 [Smallanthus sonchifolius]